MRYEFKDGRRRVGGTSSGARVDGRHEASRNRSLQQRRRKHTGAPVALMVAGALLWVVAMARTGILPEFGMGLAGAGFLSGMGFGCVVAEIEP